MYCCTGLKNLVSSAGDRGLAILAREQSPNRIGFVIQSRGLAFGDEAKWKPVSVEVIINIDCTMGLLFCPFCGRRLDDLVEESPEFFNDLAAKHKKFLASTPAP